MANKIKDRVFDWFLRNVIIPKVEEIDKPGFIINKFSKGEIVLRDVAFPEVILSFLEDKVTSEHGDAGKKRLYKAGKKFGYLYANLSGLPTIKNAKVEELKKWIYRFVRYVETVYSSNLEYKVDFEGRLFSIDLDNYVVCSLNGKGYSITDGAIAGVWAWMMQDRTMEGVQIKCQGRGDKKCKVVCGPRGQLRKMGLEFIESDSVIEKIDMARYMSMNESAKPSYSTCSLESMLQANIYSYSKGAIMFKGLRHFIIEVSFIDILEAELLNLDKKGRALFSSGYDFGKKLVSMTEKPSLQFVVDYLSSLGFGDISIESTSKGFRVMSRHHPWTEFSELKTFALFRGMVSGLLSSISGKEVKFNNYKATTMQGCLDLLIY